MEKLYIGVLFLIGSTLLAVTMAGLATDRDRARTAAWMLGTAVCAGMFVFYVLSRTTGLPLGYREEWTGSYETVLGTVSLVAELVFLGCAAASLRHRSPTLESSAAQLPLHDSTAPLR